MCETVCVRVHVCLIVLECTEYGVCVSLYVCVYVYVRESVCMCVCVRAHVSVCVSCISQAGPQEPDSAHNAVAKIPSQGET